VDAIERSFDLSMGSLPFEDRIWGGFESNVMLLNVYPPWFWSDSRVALQGLFRNSP
jgi:hypothetical protein